jgi:hypothetical protein
MSAAGDSKQFVDPEELASDEDNTLFCQYLEGKYGAIIPPRDLVRDYFSIYKVVVVVRGPDQGPERPPKIDVLTSTGNHSTLQLYSNFFDNTQPARIHTKAYFMFKPFEPEPGTTWCSSSSFERISNSVGVVQLIYGTFIDVFEKRFVEDTFTPDIIERLLVELNDSIHDGRGYFTDNITSLLAMMRNEKDKQGGHFSDPNDKERYLQYIQFIEHVLRDDLLESAGSSLQIGSLATRYFRGNKDIYPTRNDGKPVTDTFQKAAYNTFIIINITGSDGTSISIHMDMKSERYHGVRERPDMISFWNGRLIEYTTTYDFIGNVKEKLERSHIASPGDVGVDINVDAIPLAIRILDDIITRRGSNIGSNTAITTNCQFPILLYPNPNPNPKPSELPALLKNIPLFRDSYASVALGHYPPLDKEEKLGNTGYYILCPEFHVPFTLNSSCEYVQFYTNRIDMMNKWFHFPSYDESDIDRAVNVRGGVVFPSMEREFGSTSPRKLLESPSSSPESPPKSSLPKQSTSVSVSVPPPTPPTPSGQEDVTVRSDKEIQPRSYFRSIVDTVFSYFFPRTPTTLSDGIDVQINVNELLIKAAMDLADELDASTTKPEVAVLVHAVKHAYDTVLDLNQMIGDDPVYQGEVNLIIRVVSKCADVAPGAAADGAAAGAAAGAALKHLVHVSAFAVRVVACVCAYKITGNTDLSPLVVFFNVFKVENIDGISISHDNIQNIKEETYECLSSSNTRQQETGQKELKRTTSFYGGRPCSRRRSRKRQTLKKKNISRKPKYSRRSRRSRRSYSRKNDRQ